MKRYFILIILIFVCDVHSQQTVYSFSINLSDYNNAPEFEKQGNTSFYSGSDKNFENFFKDYNVVDFYQAFPASRKIANLNVFFLNTTNENLPIALINEFPNLFLSFATYDHQAELCYIPDDYGITSPFATSGAPFDRSDLDYLNTIEAWKITTGNSNVKIGISDARIKPDDLDFVNKLSFINPGPYQNWNYNPSLNGINTWHGTNTAAIAAAQGDNSYGTTGVCYDCSIVGTGYSNYNNLLVLRNEGVRIINMSWASFSFSQANQNIIDELVEDGVILIASAGNRVNQQTTTDFVDYTTAFPIQTNQLIPQYVGEQIGYPASYNGVISVSSINHRYEANDPYAIDSVSPLGFPISLYVRDSFAANANTADVNNPIGLIFNGWPNIKPRPISGFQTISPNGLVWTHTANQYVDILAPANQVMLYFRFAEENAIYNFESGGTSTSAPYVAGTVGLMKTLYDCLSPVEAENILKLTTVDVENNPINVNYMGRIGAGRLDIGSAVTFVSEMTKVNGNAKIQNHIFNRFTYNLHRINNNLIIDNVVFRENCTVDFTAKKSINLKNSTHLSPNLNGSISLKVDNNIDISCSEISQRTSAGQNSVSSMKQNVKSSTLYPNPNNGNFVLNLIGFENNCEIAIIDVNGRIVYSNLTKIIDGKTQIDVSNIKSGIYFVSISNNLKTETIKFIKN